MRKAEHRNCKKSEVLKELMPNQCFPLLKITSTPLALRQREANVENIKIRPMEKQNNKQDLVFWVNGPNINQN